MAWEPQPGAQSSALSCDWIDELLFAGERGGGKSDFQLGYQEDGALTYGKAHFGIMFRKTYPEMEELQSRALNIFTASGAVFKTHPSAQYPYSNCWYWPNGATVRMRYIERVEDYGRYHGFSFSAVSFDEVTEYNTPEGLLKMLSCLRSAHGVPCTVRLTGNPGGVGHGWVKQRYIDVAPPYTPYTDPDSGFKRIFIPSKTSDNAILLESDPKYRDRIKAATNGNEALRKAWLHGDWDIVAGAFFDCWDKDRHVIKPFTIPHDWLRFCSGDWGSARPFSFNWFAVVADDYKVSSELTLPRGCLVQYRDWYGIQIDSYGNYKANKGIKMIAEDVGKGLAEREANEKVAYGVLDPAAFSQDGGPSIHERMFIGSGRKVQFRRADNSRVAKMGSMGGWDQVRSRLIGNDVGPMLVFFDTSIHTIRTFPLLQHDKDRIEDVDTDQEDHCFAAGTLVSTNKGYVPIDKLNDYGLVLSLNGFEYYRSARLVKKDAVVVKLVFDNGVKIICTPDHKFLVKTDTMRYAIDLLNEEVLCVQQSYQQQYKNTAALDIICAISIFRGKALDCIELFGNQTTVKYQKSIMCTTKTIIDRIMSYLISNCFLKMNILAVSTESNQQLMDIKALKKPGFMQLNGTRAKPVENGIKSIMQIFLKKVMKQKLIKYVDIAAHNIKLLLARFYIVNTAVIIVKRARCVSVEPMKESRDVYCLTVPKTGLFCVDGGIVVSNCQDSVRYGCMSRPYIPAKKVDEQPVWPTQMTFNDLVKKSGELRNAQ